MKRLMGIVWILVLLSGCSAETCMNGAMQLRRNLQSATVCRFEVALVADYGDVVYPFSMNCEADGQGQITFTVMEPESISGITGKLSQEGGALTFDDVVLSFPMLAEGLVTPVSAPWVLYTALTGGYIASAGTDDTYTRVTIHDSYEDNALIVDIWLTSENIPMQADIIWQNRRIVSMQIRNFQIG